MRALVLRHWGERPAVESAPDPDPRPGTVCVEVAACGVGLTTRNCVRGDLGDDPALLPVIPGHELVGTVVTCGPGAGQDLAGRLVTAHFYLFCGRCGPCLRGEEPVCDAGGGVIGVNHDGGLAERVVLPERNIIPLPDGTDPVGATVIPDAVATPVHVARRAGIAPGARVAVIGAGGGVGAHMVQVAGRYGARVVGLDVDPGKLAFLREELGVAAIDASGPRPPALPGAWRDGADVIVDLVGTADTVAWALSRLASGGRLVLLTTFPGVSASVSPRELVLRQASVLGSRYASRSELLLAAGMVADGQIRPVIGERVGLPGAAGLLNRIDRGQVLGRGAVVMQGKEIPS